MIDTSGYRKILIDVDEAGVCTLTLNRPEKLNAFSARLSAEMNHAFAALDDDDDVRVIVVTGAGRAFSAGADLSQAGADTFDLSRSTRTKDQRQTTDELPTVRLRRPWEMATPIIAAINGAAVGMGLTLPCGWDIRIAALDAKLGFVFNRRGIIPEAGSLWTVPRLVGLSRAYDLLLSGRYFTGEEAAAIGLVSQAVPTAEVLPTAQAIGREIAKAAPMSVAMTKMLVHRFLSEDRNAAHELETRLFFWTGAQADAKEGVAAFLEKREPKWGLSKTRDLPEELRPGSDRPEA